MDCLSKCITSKCILLQSGNQEFHTTLWKYSALLQSHCSLSNFVFCWKCEHEYLPKIDTPHDEITWFFVVCILQTIFYMFYIQLIVSHPEIDSKLSPVLCHYCLHTLTLALNTWINKIKGPIYSSLANGKTSLSSVAYLPSYYPKFYNVNK